jgi:hypothetical protein
MDTTFIDNALQAQQQQTAMKVQMSLLKKNLDVQKEIGEFVVGLIDSAGLQTPGKEIGTGGNLDIYA